MPSSDSANGTKDLIELVVELFKEILNEVRSRNKPVRSSMTLKPGEIKMPLTVTMGDPPGNAVYQEFNAAGEAVPPLGVVHYASDNEAVATVDVNGVMTYVGPGTCNIAGADDGTTDGLPASDALTVNPQPTDMTPVSSTMTLTAGLKTAAHRGASHLRAGQPGVSAAKPRFVGGKFVK